jgi:hypothetical protein
VATGSGTRRQRKQSDPANNANKQNATTNRAFVTSNEVDIQEERKDGVVVGWMFRPIVVNTGNTPTNDLEYYATGTWGAWKPTDILAPTYPIGENPALLDPEQGYYNNIGNPSLPQSHLPHLVLGAHASAKMGWVELTTQQIAARAQGKLGAYIGAIIHYRDQIDPTIEHVTKFCYMIRTDSLIGDAVKPVYDLCDYWNCIDDECKNDKRRYRSYVAQAFNGKKKSVPDDFYGRPMSFLIESTYKKAQDRAQELARGADTNKYLVEPSTAAAQARSAELWQIVACRPQPSCDPVSKYLLEARPLKDGRAVLVMPQDFKDGVVASNLNGTATLTETERALVKTASEIGAPLVENGAPDAIKLGDRRRRPSNRARRSWARRDRSS